MKAFVLEKFKQTFRPEFLNRIDEVIVFHPLTREEIAQIVYLFLNRVRQSLQAQGMDLVVSEEVIKKLSAEGFDPMLGARPLRRVIQRRIEDPLAEEVLEGNSRRRYHQRRPARRQSDLQQSRPPTRPAGGAERGAGTIHGELMPSERHAQSTVPGLSPGRCVPVAPAPAPAPKPALPESKCFRERFLSRAMVREKEPFPTHATDNCLIFRYPDNPKTRKTPTDLSLKCECLIGVIANEKEKDLPTDYRSFSLANP